MDKQNKVDPSNRDYTYCETSGAKLACAACTRKGNLITAEE
jgi:hypothetical protein